MTDTKAPRIRRFAAALLCALLTFAAFAIFPDFFTRLTETMRQAVHPAPVGEVIPVA